MLRPGDAAQAAQAAGLGGLAAFEPVARPADLLLANASVLTLDPRQPRGEAVAVRGGRVLAVGALADLRPLVGPSTEVVDAEGGLAVPAFHDAHLHLLS